MLDDVGTFLKKKLLVRISTHHVATASSRRLVVPSLLGLPAKLADPLEGVERAFLRVDVQQVLHGSAYLSARVYALRAAPLQMIAVLVVIIVPLAHLAPDILQRPGPTNGARAWRHASGEATRALGSSPGSFHHHHARWWHRHR